MEPVAPPQERGERRSRGAPDEWRGVEEVAAVANQVPVAGETAQALHRGKIDEPVLQDFVGRIRAIDHPPCRVMTSDWCAAQPLQNPDLNLLRMESEQTIESRGKAFQRFARQSDNQIGVNVNAGAGTKETQVVGEPVIVLPAADQPAHLRIE